VSAETTVDDRWPLEHKGQQARELREGEDGLNDLIGQERRGKKAKPAKGVTSY